MQLNETHDPALRSWVSSANGHSDFPIQNLPYASFRKQGERQSFCTGVAIGDKILDLQQLYDKQLMDADVSSVLALAAQPKLNAFMALPEKSHHLIRLMLSRALRDNSPFAAKIADCLVPQADVEFQVPCHIGDYTDFYTSIHHATAVGALFRPDNPLLPNYKWIPIGYHGRSSSINVSGQSFPRPIGQLKNPDDAQPELAPSQQLDYELEMGVFIGAENAPGEPLSMTRADSQWFGMCLLNDWSARDIQAWEYQPLGPFLAKNFASTLSPWIVTREALAPFRTQYQRPDDDPQPLPYLDSTANSEQGAIDIHLSTAILTPQMREQNAAPAVLGKSNFKHAYWTIAQMLTHHTVNGCPLKAGDLLGSGTMSGPEPEQAGSLLELTQGGKRAIELPNGETRTFLQDGDEVVLSAWCENADGLRIGFGDCRGVVLPSRHL